MPPLQLKYGFTPDPNPIRASALGANPSVIDLQVTISNDLTAPIVVSGINIQIPVRADDARTLSAAPLPAPLFDPTQWQISIDGSGSTVMIRPVSGSTITIGADPILFTLPGIKVNETPSAAVPITITEISATGTKATDNSSYAMAKQPSDLLVTSFTAARAALNDLNESTRLFWACTDEGKRYAYRLRADDSTRWQPRNCIGDGNCFGWQDGVSGVLTVPLNPTDDSGVITFKLDAIQTDGAHGNRSVYQTVITQVQVGLPKILGNTRATVYHGGLVRLHWVAVNAAYCMVQLEDGTVVAANAPLNTYQNGYPVILPNISGPHRITVTAFAASGEAQYPYTFPDITVKPPVTVPAQGSAVAVAKTPSGELAVVLNEIHNTVTVFEVGTWQMRGAPVQVLGAPRAVAISPDGSLAFAMTREGTARLAVIDLATGQAEPNRIVVGGWPSAIAVTPDGRLALVVSLDMTVIVVDVSGRSMEPGTIPVGISPNGIAITPDGALALVTNNDGCDVTVIDIAARKARPSTIRVGAGPSGIAITPDGSLALVTNANSNDVTVIDIATLAVHTTIALGCSPFTIAITADGGLALVPASHNQVLAIDIPSLTVVPGGMPVSIWPVDVAFGPGDAYALMADFNDGNVVMV